MQVVSFFFSEAKKDYRSALRSQLLKAKVVHQVAAAEVMILWQDLQVWLTSQIWVEVPTPMYWK